MVYKVIRKGSIEHSDILVHHGILGQKWGVRRYQNRDGSYTQEGKKRLLKNGLIGGFIAGPIGAGIGAYKAIKGIESGKYAAQDKIKGTKKETINDLECRVKEYNYNGDKEYSALVNNHGVSGVNEVHLDSDSHEGLSKAADDLKIVKQNLDVSGLKKSVSKQLQTSSGLTADIIENRLKNPILSVTDKGTYAVEFEYNDGLHTKYYDVMNLSVNDKDAAKKKKFTIETFD